MASITKAERSLDKLQPTFKTQVKRFLEENPEVFVTETYRSESRQRYLYDTGKSYLDGSKDSMSMHQKGLAIDIAFYGTELYPKNHEVWKKVGASANRWGIDWGYDLWAHTGFIDKPHFQDKSTDFVMPPKLDSWQINAIEWAKDNQVSNGERPLDPITRVEVMEMMRKYNKRFS